MATSLYLVFHAGSDRFVIESARVVEVLPLLAWKQVKGAPGVVGLVNYHGTAVPLLDWTILVTGQPSIPRMSTRLLMIRLDDGTHLALMVERVAGTLRADPANFVAPPPVADTAPYLGPILTDGNGILQRVNVNQLLSAEGRAYVVARWSDAA